MNCLEKEFRASNLHEVLRVIFISQYITQGRISELVICVKCLKRDLQVRFLYELLRMRPLSPITHVKRPEWASTSYELLRAGPLSRWFAWSAQIRFSSRPLEWIIQNEIFEPVTEVKCQEWVSTLYKMTLNRLIKLIIHMKCPEYYLIASTLSYLLTPSE